TNKGKEYTPAQWTEMIKRIQGQLASNQYIEEAKTHQNLSEELKQNLNVLLSGNTFFKGGSEAAITRLSVNAYLMKLFDVLDAIRSATEVSLHGLVLRTITKYVENGAPSSDVIYGKNIDVSQILN